MIDNNPIPKNETLLDSLSRISGLKKPMFVILFIVYLIYSAALIIFLNGFSWFHYYLKNSWWTSRFGELIILITAALPCGIYYIIHVAASKRRQKTMINELKKLHASDENKYNDLKLYIKNKSE